MGSKLQALKDAMIQKAKNFLALFKQDLSTLWANNKGFVIFFGVLLLVIKFRSILIDILLKSAQSIFKDAEKKGDQLQQEEKQANDQANDLTKKAEDLPSQEKPVDDDWNKNG